MKIVKMGGIDYYEVREGLYIPVKCNAAYFGGKASETLTITPAQARDLFGRQALLPEHQNSELRWSF